MVRVQANNLANTVAEYYCEAGADDLVQIYLPQWTEAKKERLPGGKNYLPVFRYNLKHAATIKYCAAWKKMCGPRMSLIPEAMETFGQLVREDPEYADAWFALADALCFMATTILIDRPEERDDALAQAETFIETGLELAPETWHCCATSAFWNLLRGELDEAARLFKAALAVNREMTEGHPAYLLFYLAANGLNASDLMESRALELSTNPDLQAVHGRMLEWSDKLDEAERHYRQALDLDPNSGLCHLALGRLLTKMGKTEEAARHMERAAILIGPEDLQMWLSFEQFANRPDESATESE
jgi:tetratricopeptide (TPR) repeat protein